MTSIRSEQKQNTVEHCLERPPHWPQKCGLSKQVVFGDTFSYDGYIEI